MVLIFSNIVSLKLFANNIYQNFFNKMLENAFPKYNYKKFRGLINRRKLFGGGNNSLCI